MTEPLAVPTEYGYAALADLLTSTYASTTELVAAIEPRDFGMATRTVWTVQELLFHQLLDAQRALIVFATPDPGPPDRDHVSYWSTFNPKRAQEGDADAHIQFVRVAASAYAGSYGLVDQWRHTSEAAGRAARTVAPQEFLATQGHVLAAPDFVHTLLVEAVVHHLDLTVDLPSPGLPEDAYTAVLEVLIGLNGGPLPPSWAPTEAILKGTGRSPLNPSDLGALGGLEEGFPLFG